MNGFTVIMSTWSFIVNVRGTMYNLVKSYTCYFDLMQLCAYHNWSSREIDYLNYIISCICSVTTRDKENMMTSENLSIVFGPTLMRTPEDLNLLESQSAIKDQKLVVQRLIEDYITLFGA